MTKRIKSFSPPKPTSFNPGRSERQSFYKSKEWKAARRRKLRRDPLCAVCGEPANTVHHERALAEGGAPLDPANQTSMCRSCHSVLEARRRRDLPNGETGRQSNG